MTMTESQINRISKYRLVDLFCGCGGLSLGFQNAGFNITDAYDFWDLAIEIYNNNFSHPIHKLDLGNPDSIDIIAQAAPNFIIGGPPCQDYSTSGKRDESQGRAALSLAYANIVASIRPQFFLMENVPNMQKGKTIGKVNKIFKEAGYGLNQLVLDASLCGVPQKRLRFITFGVLDGTEGEALPYFTKNLAKKSMTLRDYFGDSLGFEHYFRVPTSYKRRGVYSIDEPSMTIRGVDRPVPTGYPGHPADSAPISPDIRALTYQERAQIQTFPKDFIWKGSKTQVNQAIGNAVPVRFAQYLANAVIEYINENG